LPAPIVPSDVRYMLGVISTMLGLAMSVMFVFGR